MCLEDKAAWKCAKCNRWFGISTKQVLSDLAHILIRVVDPRSICRECEAEQWAANVKCW